MPATSAAPRRRPCRGAARTATQTADQMSSESCSAWSAFGWFMTIGCSARPSRRAAGVENARRGRCRCRHRRRRRSLRQSSDCSAPQAWRADRADCSMSSNIRSGCTRRKPRLQCRRLPACEPPVKAKTRMPAACAASMPAGLSSMTMQFCGRDAHARAPHAGKDRAPACRAPPCEALKICGSSSRSSPVTRATAGCARAGSDEATQRGTPMPGERLGDARDRLQLARGTRCVESPRIAVRCSSVTTRPKSSRRISLMRRHAACRGSARRRSSSLTVAAGLRRSCRAAPSTEIGSLSTSTPSQSKMTSSERFRVIGLRRHLGSGVGAVRRSDARRYPRLHRQLLPAALAGQSLPAR